MSTKIVFLCASSMNLEFYFKKNSVYSLRNWKIWLPCCIVTPCPRYVWKVPDKLLMNKLPNVLNEEQKKNKIGNLLKQLRMDKKIYADNHRVWHLSKE